MEGFQALAKLYIAIMVAVVLFFIGYDVWAWLSEPEKTYYYIQ